MTIIEADGVETQPLTVDSLTIFAAQRYSIIVNADQAVDNYCELHRITDGNNLTRPFNRDPCQPVRGQHRFHQRNQLCYPALRWCPRFGSDFDTNNERHPSQRSKSSRELTFVSKVSRINI